MTLENLQIFFYIVASSALIVVLVVAVMIGLTLAHIRATIEARVRGFQAMQNLIKVSFLRSLLRLLK